MVGFCVGQLPFILDITRRPAQPAGHQMQSVANQPPSAEHPPWSVDHQLPPVDHQPPSANRQPPRPLDNRLADGLSLETAAALRPLLCAKTKKKRTIIKTDTMPLRDASCFYRPMSLIDPQPSETLSQPVRLLDLIKLAKQDIEILHQTCGRDIGGEGREAWGRGA